jgi:hypothetical protein
VKSTLAGTVTVNRNLTNAPLVVRNLDDATLAAIAAVSVALVVSSGTGHPAPGVFGVFLCR